MLTRARVAAIVSGLALSHAAFPQNPRVTIRGVAYDSLHRVPLRNASITIAGAGSKAISDARGRFHFDSVLPGDYTFVVEHPALDSVGFRALPRRATITDGRDEVRLAIPSFNTLWRVACGGGEPSRDSGFVYGTVRDALTLSPVANARVDLTWTDLVVDKRHRVLQRRWHIQTRTEATGSYTVCGVPTALGLRIQAAVDSSASGQIDLVPRDARAQRRDLLIGSLGAGDSTRRGTIVGMLTDASGQFFSDARIIMDEVPEVRSGPDGRFTLSDVPSGTRQIEVRAIGLMPVLSVVDVIPGDTVSVALNVGKLVILRGMRVTAATPTRRFAAEFDMRRKQGLGYTMDSTDIGKYPRFVNVLNDIPGIRPEYHGVNFLVTVPDARGGRCVPEVRIDGTEAGYGHLVDLFPHEVAAVEVYPHAGTIPMEFAKPGIQPLCGMILVWTKYGFRNR
jgi:hypothetical protein